MAERVGSKIIAGLETHANTWHSGSGATIGAGDGIEMIVGSGNWQPKQQWADNAQSPEGAAMMVPGTLVKTWAEGSLQANFNYHSALARAFACWYGSEAAALATDGTVHTFTMAVDSATKILTQAWYDNLVVHDIPHAVCTGFSAEWADGGPGKVTIAGLGSRELVDDSGTNTISGMASATLPTQPAIRYLTMSAAQCVVRINTHSGGSLSSGDNVYPSAIKIYGTRKPKQFLTTRNAPFIDQPVASDWIDMGIDLTFPIDQANTLYAAAIAGTAYKATVTFTGTLIGTDSYKWAWEFPYLQLGVDGLPTNDGPTAIGWSLPLKAKKARANPTGMSTSLWPSLKVTDIITGLHLDSATS